MISVVDASPVADAKDEDALERVLDVADDPPVSDAVGPQRHGSAFQRLADPPGIGRREDSLAQETKDAALNLDVEVLDLLRRRTDEFIPLGQAGVPGP